MDDLISRQAAIDALDKRFDDVPMEQTANILQLRRDLRGLPSEQPELSSVRENDADHIWYKGKQFISLTWANTMLMEHSKYTDIISRQMAIEALEEHEKSEGHNYSMFQSVVSECAEVIRDLPSVQPERKRGKWQITDAYPHNVYCSECHKRFAQTHWAVWEDGTLPRDFRPSCGADMRGEHESVEG